MGERLRDDDLRPAVRPLRRYDRSNQERERKLEVHSRDRVYAARYGVDCVRRRL